MILKDERLPDNLVYEVEVLEPGYRGLNTPCFTATIRADRIMNEFNNLMLASIVVDKIIIESDQRDNLPKFQYSHCVLMRVEWIADKDQPLRYVLHFEALRLETIFSEEQQREYEVIDMISRDILYIGLKPNQCVIEPCYPGDPF